MYLIYTYNLMAGGTVYICAPCPACASAVPEEASYHCFHSNHHKVVHDMVLSTGTRQTNIKSTQCTDNLCTYQTSPPPPAIHPVYK